MTGRVAETTGQAFNVPYDEGDGAGKFHFISEVLRWRAQTQPDNQLFTLVDARVSGWVGGSGELERGTGSSPKTFRYRYYSVLWEKM